MQQELRRDLEATGAQWDQRLLRWVDFLDEELRVIVVAVPSDDDAFLFFETLNDRGLGLSTSDLLKNYLYSQGASLLPGIEIAWSSSVRSLEAYADEALYTNFVRQYWSSLYGATRERSLYREIRRRIRGPKEALDLATGLQVDAPKYAALLDATHDYWKASPQDMRELVETLLRLRLEQNRPLLLAGLDVLPGLEIPQFLLSAATWGVRGIVVGGIGGGTSESYYADAAVALREGSSRTIEDVSGGLSRIVPTDREFRAAFARLTPTKLYLAKYFLIALQLHENDGPGRSIVGNDEDAKWAIRAALAPSELGDSGVYPVEDASTLARRLGNLVLVPTKDVRNFDQASAEQRWSVLSAQTPRWLLEGEPAEIIESRQTHMAEKAIGVWPRLSG